MIFEKIHHRILFRHEVLASNKKQNATIVFLCVYVFLCFFMFFMFLCFYN